MSILGGLKVLRPAPKRRIQRAGIQHAFVFFWKHYEDHAASHPPYILPVSFESLCAVLPWNMCYMMWAVYDVHAGKIDETLVRTKNSRHARRATGVPKKTRRKRLQKDALEKLWKNVDTLFVVDYK